MGIVENDTWQSLRIGLSGETMLTDRLKITADAAYLPYVQFRGQDNHLDFNPVKVFPEWSNGGQGLQVEALLSYALTEQFSIGVGGRYWAAWTTNGEYTLAAPWTCNGAPCGNSSAQYKTERAGIFAQASYRLGAESIVPLK